MMQNLAVPVSECWLKHKHDHMRTGRMMMDPKFAKLLAEHIFYLCFDNRDSPRASLGPCVPRGLAASSKQSENAVAARFPFSQGQLAEKEQDLRDPSKNLKLTWYPVKTRDLHLPVHCLHLSQLLTNSFSHLGS